MYYHSPPSVEFRNRCHCPRSIHAFISLLTGESLRLHLIPLHTDSEYSTDRDREEQQRRRTTEDEGREGNRLTYLEKTCFEPPDVSGLELPAPILLFNSALTPLELEFLSMPCSVLLGPPSSPVQPIAPEEVNCKALRRREEDRFRRFFPA